MRVRPAGREACNCASPYNSILERLDAMEAEILTAMQEANTAVGIANAALRQVQAAGIRTVNQIQPDEDGEFSISAGSGIQINAGTNGIEIKNTSQGAIYTGVSPITINASNEISLDGWNFVKNNQFDTIIDSNNVFLQDTVFIAGYARARYDSLFIPKGTTIANTTNLIFNYDQNSSLFFYKGAGLFSTSTTMSCQLTQSILYNNSWTTGVLTLIFENSTNNTANKIDTNVAPNSGYWIAALIRKA